MTEVTLVIIHNPDEIQVPECRKEIKRSFNKNKERLRKLFDVNNFFGKSYRECAECGVNTKTHLIRNFFADDYSIDKIKVKFYTCSSCQMIHYCSVDCQKKHWNIHKKNCKELKNKWCK